jgi:peptide deformylase
MTRLLGDALGAGLAATQLGVMHRVFVYHADPDRPIEALVNPELEWASERTEVDEEGCLSIPGPFHPTERSTRVELRGQDLEGRPIEMAAEGLLARIFQHETDHLDGVLYIDRLDDEGRRDVLRQLRQIELQSKT